MNRIRFLIFLPLLSWLLTACTWVTVTEAGKSVKVLTSEQITNCKEIGKAHAQVKYQVAGVDRSPEKMQQELNVIAQNNAAMIDGNAIVPEGAITQGKQSFKVYQCP